MAVSGAVLLQAIDQETVDRLREDDEALMHFSFKYLASTLFGAEGLNIRKSKVMEKAKAMRQEQEDNLRRIEEDYRNLKAAREQEARKKA
jgi:hypothetical protein